jgi:amino acid transporter
MNFGFGFTEVGVLVGICSMYNYGLNTGGPSAIIWGWIVSFLMSMVVSFSMAEICSAYPSAGSVYHWSGQLVPEEWTAFASYVCGWCNFVGNAAGDSSFAFAWATLLDAAVVASGGNASEMSTLVGISILVLLVWSLLNILRIDNLGWLTTLATVVHIGAMLCIVIGILSRAEVLRNGDFVFTDYNNYTGFTDKSYVGAISLLAALYSFSGYEASAHMAEETHDAAENAPLGIIYTCLMTGLVGLALSLTLLFSTSNIDLVLNYDDYFSDDYNSTSLTRISDGTGNAAFNVLLDAGGLMYGRAMCWLVVIVTFFAGMSSVSVTGRITYALARDEGFPGSKYIAYVHPRLKSPVGAILFVFLIDVFLQLLPLGSSVAFYSITGITVIGFQTSYAIPIFLKLVCRPSDFPKTAFNLGYISYPLA